MLYERKVEIRLTTPWVSAEKRAAPTWMGAALLYPLLLTGIGKEKSQSQVIPVPPLAMTRLLTMNAARMNRAVIVGIISNPPFRFNSRLPLRL